MIRIRLILIIWIVLVSGNLFSQSLGLKGQAIGWTTLNPAEPFQAQAGLRYIPELDFTLPAGKYSVEGEFSVNLWGSGIYSQDSIDLDEDISPYRMWINCT